LPSGTEIGLPHSGPKNAAVVETRNGLWGADGRTSAATHISHFTWTDAFTITRIFRHPAGLFSSGFGMVPPPTFCMPNTWQAEFASHIDTMEAIRNK